MLYALCMIKIASPSPAVSAERAADFGDRLQLMATFVRIVESGSLSAAAAQMQITQPTISRRLQTLERSLGVRLLQRSTHGMGLTLEGERCFERAKELLANWAAFEADLRGAQETPEGLLRVAVPHAFGQEHYVGPLAEFLRACPRVSVEWVLRDEVHDFIVEGVDCAIQVGEPTDPSVVAIKLAEVRRIVVAAPSVLEGQAIPQDANGLQALPWLSLKTYYRREITLTHRRSGESQRIALRPVMSTDSLYALRSAALHGLGVAVGSRWMLTKDLAQGRLLHLAPAWCAQPLPVYLTYPYASFYPSRLLRFVALMRDAIPQTMED